jgi:hypothetical protein
MKRLMNRFNAIHAQAEPNYLPNLVQKAAKQGTI